MCGARSLEIGDRPATDNGVFDKLAIAGTRSRNDSEHLEVMCFEGLDELQQDVGRLDPQDAMEVADAGCAAPAIVQASTSICTQSCTSLWC